MAIVGKIQADIVAGIDQASFNKASNQIKQFARDTGKELDNTKMMKLEINSDVARVRLLELKNQIKALGGELNAPRELRIETKNAQSNLTEANRKLQNFKNTGDENISRLQAKFNGLGDTIKSQGDALKAIFTGNLTAGVTALGNSFKGASVGATAFNIALLPITAVLGAIVLLIPKFVEATVAYQKYESVLTNALGSHEQAIASMELINDIASKTPFSIDQLTQSYIKLVNRGFIPTEAEIVKLGDLASSQGKNFDQLVEAMLDAQTGEFERLKEFGVRAKASGDDVSFTFKGVTTTVKKTDEEIKNYILSLGELNGVQGGMAEQSKTLGGQISNLGDNAMNLAKIIGNSLSPAFSKVIFIVNKFIDIILWVANTGLPKVSETFQIFTTVTASQFTKLGLYIGNMIGNFPIAFAGAFNTVSKYIENFLNNSLGKLVEGVQKIPGLGDFGEGWGNIKLPTFDINKEKKEITSELAQIENHTTSEIAKIQNKFRKIDGPSVITSSNKALTGGGGSGGSSGGGGAVDKQKEFRDNLAKEDKRIFDDFAKTLSTSYDNVGKSIEDTKKKIIGLDSDIAKTQSKINDLMTTAGGDIAGRVVKITEELKNQNITTEEKLRLEQELALATANTTEEQIKRAELLAGENTTERIIRETAEKKAQLEAELLDFQTQKTNQELVLQTSIDKQKQIEANYTAFFKSELVNRENSAIASFRRIAEARARILGEGGGTTNTTTNNGPTNITVNAKTDSSPKDISKIIIQSLNDYKKGNNK